MIPPVIIGLTGAARSGKSTIANHLQDKYGFHVLSFADPLKAMVKKLDPIIGLEEAVQYAEYDAPTAYPVHLGDYLTTDGDFQEDTPEDWVKEEFPEYRRILQTLGTECIRGLDQDFWVNVMNDRIQEIFLDDNSARIVIPDMRFPNEVDVLRRWMALTELVNVVRPGLRRSGVHISERHEGRMGETTIFVNDGTLSELLESVDNYMKGFLA